MRTRLRHHTTSQRTRQQSGFRLQPIAGIIASLFIAASGSVYAADPTVADLQAEILKLKQKKKDKIFLVVVVVV